MDIEDFEREPQKFGLISIQYIIIEALYLIL